MRFIAPIIALLITFTAPVLAVEEPDDEKTYDTPFNEKTFAGLELRGIGPAFMSGRIADIAIHPTEPSTWYVAVGSGGVWKTTNAGTTWTPVFDKMSSYSTGCVTIDPSNPEVIWIGTGENVGGRHVGFGDGVYRSRDGGATWKNLGIEDSQHISKILLDPRDTDVVFVASQGPLWSSGGDRGLFRSDDGGTTWRKVLGGGEWTGVTDIVLDPRDPDLMYAATWQHHRNVAAVMDGGPESGLHKSTDGGLTWRRLSTGLPKEAMGKIGLAISLQRPDVVYAVIELDNRTGGLFRSANRGESWKKMSDTVSGATGPHYYQELYASPHAFDRLYLMDVRVQISDDGGTTFRRMKEKHKHSDNHALAFLPDDRNYLLVGTDGGIYESFDLAENWRFVANLPLTQFYKVAVDDSEPFYFIYGGTQDNSTQGGPSRTDSSNGIRNSDWFITLFADGHQPATEPGNPDIVYSEWQQGNLVRHDRTTGEIVYLQPQGEPGDPAERWNWDSPVLLSPHSPTRLYYASQRVWRSDDRGDSWQAISPDLTRDQDRMLLPLMGRVWSYDSPWDLDAMSWYNTITSLAESPVLEGLLYAGTDDGLIQVSEDGGDTWRKIEVGSLPSVPDTAFVNDIKADLFDADTVYAALDNHKFGDFAPYLLKSTDRGRTWKPITGDLPNRHLVWRVVQDHVNSELLFAATEFGIFFTVDGGGQWVKLKGGVPTISFRDLAIQRRENDLVGASFGRSFYVLDDYSALREVSVEALESEALLFPVRRAWWYVERTPLGGKGRADQGAGYFVAPNPPFGAVFSYYLNDKLKSRKKLRREREKPLEKTGDDTPYPGWEEIERERREEKPALLLTVTDSQGTVVRRIKGTNKAGFHRVAWDLRAPSPQPVTGDKPPAEAWDEPPGFLTAPGTYSVTLSKRVDGQITDLAGPVPFEVVRLREGALPGSTPEQTVEFLDRVREAVRAVTGAEKAITAAFKRMAIMKTALDRSNADPAGELDTALRALESRLYEAEYDLVGNRSRKKIGEATVRSVLDRLQVATIGVVSSTYGPTATHRRSLELAERQFAEVRETLSTILDVELPELENEMDAAGVPWTPGRRVPAIRR